MSLNYIFSFDSIKFYFILTLPKFVAEGWSNSENGPVDIIWFNFSFGLVNLFFVLSHSPLNKEIVIFFMNEPSPNLPVSFLSVDKPIDLDLRGFNFVGGVSFWEIDKDCLHIVSSDSVQTHFGMAMSNSMETELLSFHVECTYWWVVRNLFEVGWNTSDQALESFS